MISYLKARQQSSDENHPLNDELQLLAVHGMLHLLGYDHLTASDRKIMWQKQEAILVSLGIQPDSLLYLEPV